MGAFLDNFAETGPVVALAFGVPLAATLGVTAYQVNAERHKQNQTQTQTHTQMSKDVAEKVTST